MLFSELGLKPEILRAIEERGYKEPTPIQEVAIPYVLMGRDVLGCAQTGTGKTAGFCLPMLEILSNGRAKARMPRSLILEPTRELAAQVAESFDIYGKYMGLTVALLVGGTGMDEQIKKLDRGVDVLIATPGRMMDLFERGKIMLNDIKILVIDEADRMLDMGFIPDIEKIASLLPKIRQTLFFSATMPPEIRRLADKFLMNPKEVSVSPPATTAENVEQVCVKLSDRDKRDALRGLLKQDDLKSAFIFSNRKRDVGGIVSSLIRHGFAAGSLHGDMPQAKRNEALEKFKSGEIAYLVCSDVAARGLDIKGVDAVFNFDTPFNAEDYVHRIGRTGRAGHMGKAYTFVTPDDDKSFANILQLIKREVKEISLPAFAKATARSDDPSRRSLGGGGEGIARAEARLEGGERPARQERGGRGRQHGAGGGRGRRDEQRGNELRERHKRPERQERHAQDGQGPAPRRERSEPRGEHRPQQDRAPEGGQQQQRSNVVGFGEDTPSFLRGGPARPNSGQAEKQSA